LVRPSPFSRIAQEVRLGTPKILYTHFFQCTREEVRRPAEAAARDGEEERKAGPGSKITEGHQCHDFFILPTGIARPRQLDLRATYLN
jgi:hypothetical protein